MPLRILRPNIRPQTLLSSEYVYEVQVPAQKNKMAEPSLTKCLKFPYEALQMKSAFYHRTLGVLSIGALPTGSSHGGER